MNFLGRGRAVSGGLTGSIRTAFQDIRYVSGLTVEAHGFDDFGEELAGAADEGLTLLIFIGARSFADEHQGRVDVADAPHHVFARTGEVWTFDANHGALAQGGNVRCFVARGRDDNRCGFRRRTRYNFWRFNGFSSRHSRLGIRS